MSLVDTLQEDLKKAMKARDELRVSTIRLVKSSVSYARIDKGGELTDDEVLEVLSREAKRRRETIEMAEDAGREDIARRESTELEIIQSYLPKQLSEDEIRVMASRIAAEVGATDVKDKGKVMGPLMQKARGRADGKLVAQVVDEILRG